MVYILNLPNLRTSGQYHFTSFILKEDLDTLPRRYLSNQVGTHKWNQLYEW